MAMGQDRADVRGGKPPSEVVKVDLTKPLNVTKKTTKNGREVIVIDLADKKRS